LAAQIQEMRRVSDTLLALALAVKRNAQPTYHAAWMAEANMVQSETVNVLIASPE